MAVIEKGWPPVLSVVASLSVDLATRQSAEVLTTAPRCTPDVRGKQKDGTIR